MDKIKIQLTDIVAEEITDTEANRPEIKTIVKTENLTVTVNCQESSFRSSENRVQPAEPGG